MSTAPTGDGSGILDGHRFHHQAQANGPVRVVLYACTKGGEWPGMWTLRDHAHQQGWTIVHEVREPASWHTPMAGRHAWDRVLELVVPGRVRGVLVPAPRHITGGLPPGDSLTTWCRRNRAFVAALATTGRVPDLLPAP
jgi:hypothetical protein